MLNYLANMLLLRATGEPLRDKAIQILTLALAPAQSPAAAARRLEAALFAVHGGGDGGSSQVKVQPLCLHLRIAEHTDSCAVGCAPSSADGRCRACYATVHASKIW